MISVCLNMTHGIVQMLSSYTGTPEKPYSTLRCMYLTDSSCTAQVIVCAHCAGRGLAKLQHFAGGWLLCLHILHTPAQDQPDSPQHAQLLPTACNIQGHADLNARQGGPCLCREPFLQSISADLVLAGQSSSSQSQNVYLVQKRHPYTENLNFRDLEDAEASVGGDSGDSPVWHGRQSKDERLADAAESRLLGLAAQPPVAVHSTQHDLEPRHHQPVSYARRKVQV